MSYLIPALSVFMMTIISKHPQYASQYINNIKSVINHLLTSQMRMEKSALQIAQSVFEKIGLGFDSGELLHTVLMGIFTALHFYRNNTKSKVIPSAIMRCVHNFFSVFMICHSSKALLEACDKIQPNILFMILKSEGGAIKYVSEPARDRKYCLVAYSRLMAEYAPKIPIETIKEVINALIESSCPASKAADF